MRSSQSDGAPAQEPPIEMQAEAAPASSPDASTMRATQILEQLLQRLEGQLPIEKATALRGLTSRILDQSEVLTAAEFKARIESLLGSDLERMQAAMRSFKREHARAPRRVPSTTAQPAMYRGIEKPRHKLDAAIRQRAAPAQRHSLHS
mmetsp:Transcript_22981/g.59092  ORF Transcript_22981/g.59092 Transcript_22981/m.59092 type:complete len:149 (+) Transcript_22981:25-471(+)